MNKYVVVTLVMVVLLVALAEIYFALSLDQHLQNGRWNITLNWTLKSLPDEQPNSLSQFIYSSQTSTTSSNFSSFNISKTVNLSETAEFRTLTHVVDNDGPIKINIPSDTQDFHPISMVFPAKQERKTIDYNYPDCGFHPLD
ncbi:uncharacterized protein LOC128997186 [Macrosteles quadrilineatus]|uniref:uncharacterized protein LOC128997186 n=1 Tax=Macrosteles quadrilineatus TaxID=74068 RepID=UPI0023E33E6E|nr:uncharacterized protein LOC128997186 [Macrosteles quadrilineatus]